MGRSRLYDLTLPVCYVDWRLLHQNREPEHQPFAIVHTCAICGGPASSGLTMKDSEIVAHSVRWNGDGSYTPTCVQCRWEGKPRERHSEALAAVRSHFQTIGHANARRG